MKINNLLYTNQNKTYSHYGNSPNVSFGQEKFNIITTPKSDSYSLVDIFDKQYLFRITEETKDANILESMIENIKKTLTGFFIKFNTHEYFVPYILKKAPDIVSQRYIVENGNSATELDEESRSAFELIQAQANEQFDIKKLKTIKYLKTTILGYSNNTVEKAYSYFDRLNSDLYLYFPSRNKMQILNSENFVKKIKFTI